MRSRRTSALVVLLALVIGPLLVAATAQGTPEGEMVLAWHVTIAPAWFDPIDTPAQITPYGALHALHDALVRPLPGEKMGNSLAESWTESPDGLVYEFKLREGLKFHNGDSFTAEDVKFSFERYRGVGANELHAKVKAVEVIDPHRVRFLLHGPLARLHDVLWHHRNRRRHRRPQAIPGAGGGRGFQKASDWPRPVSVRQPHPWSRGRAGGL